MKKKLSLLLGIVLVGSQALMATVHNVSVNSNFYSPASLTINQGDTVIWSNVSGSHNVNGSTSTYPNNPVGFSNGSASSASWTYQFIFNTPGTYDYQCDPHAGLGMTGTITVNAVSQPIADCSAPFFSEYIEGSSNNKGFEIYNPTSGSLDLGPYKVMLSGNGGSFTNSFNLTGNLASGEVYVITTDQADPTMLAEADTALAFPSVAHFNGDDALFLMDTVTGDTLDIIGVVGVDPGSSWTVGSGSTQNYTLVRMSSVKKGETDWSVASGQWMVNPQNTYSFLGSHSSSCVIAPCSAPFFSEYIEGSSNNKGFEIYNPTSGSLDLGPYKVMLSGNGGSFTNSFNLTGNLASDDVYVITTDQADPTMLAAADTSLAFPSVAHFNGDDALFLMDTVTGDTLDIIGVVGVDPGSSWTVGSGSTQDHTLERMSSVDKGTTDWSVSSGQWNVNPQNTYSLLGSHSSNCIQPSNPTVTFDMASSTALESAGTVTVSMSISPASTATNDTVYLQFSASPTVNVPGDLTVSPFPDPTTLILALPLTSGTDSISFDVNIVDDQLVEGAETLTAVILNSSTLPIGADTSHTLTINDNDIPTYSINQVTGNDANFEPDSLGVNCRLYGTVFTPDFDGNSGYSFYIHDGTDGINVFDFSDFAGYTNPQIGDSIRVMGEIDFYRGLTEIAVDSIVLISSGNPITSATQVFDLDETTESELIRLNGYYVADTAQWPTTTGSQNVDITNGIDTLVMRIDSDTDIDGTPAPTGYFDVIGVGGQFDFSGPFNEGYQIFPRDTNDIMPVSLPDVDITEVMPSSNLNAPLNGDWFEVTNNTGQSIDLQGYSWTDAGMLVGVQDVIAPTSIPAGETALFVNVDTADLTAWVAEWKQTGNNLIILSPSVDIGGGVFAELNDTGDVVKLYDTDGRLVSAVSYQGSDVNAGFSLEFDNSGMLIGSSSAGNNGAYTSNNGDVGSPGNTPPISVEEFLSGNWSIYPNPANDYFVLDDHQAADKTIIIRNISGAMLMQQKSASEQVRIDVSTLPAGVYTIELRVGETSAVQKLIVR